jgi:TRAP-type C4-dicarboxylate transport system permease small subunit
MTYLGIVLCMNVGVKSTIVLRLPYIYIDVVVVVCFGMVSVIGIVKLIRRFAGKYEYVDSVTRTINEVSEK